MCISVDLMEPISFFHGWLVFIGTLTFGIYSLSLHDALPIFSLPLCRPPHRRETWDTAAKRFQNVVQSLDRKSTRLNSSHTVISYAVFCLKKKNTSYNDCWPA